MDELMHGPLQAKLLEHNVRFGDPECQCLMTRLQSDLLPLLLAASNPRGESPLRTKSGPPQLKVDQRQQRPWLRAGHPHLLQTPCAQSREVQTGSRTWTGQLGCSPGEAELCRCLQALRCRAQTCNGPPRQPSQWSWQPRATLGPTARAAPSRAWTRCRVLRWGAPDALAWQTVKLFGVSARSPGPSPRCDGAALAALSRCQQPAQGACPMLWANAKCRSKGHSAVTACCTLAPAQQA